MKRWIIFLGLILLFVGCNQAEPPSPADFLQDDLAFVAHDSSVHVVNIADPPQPEQFSQDDHAKHQQHVMGQDTSNSGLSLRIVNGNR